MALVEPARALDVLRVEEHRLLSREERRADAAPDRVADAVARDGGDAQQDVEPPDVQRARRGHEARTDQQRIAGQEKPDEQSGLDEDDREQDRIAAPAHRDVDDRVGRERPDEIVQPLHRATCRRRQGMATAFIRKSSPPSVPEARSY